MNQRNAVRTISVVIPTWNETAELSATVERLRGIPEIVEILVADGGSTDGTIALAAQLGCKVVSAPRGRGTQMRLGAAQATGDVVLLLHADTWLEPNAGRAILDALNDSDAVAGGCWKRFREPHWLMRGSRFKCFLRFQLLRRFGGDQGMFIRRGVLEKIGGVPDVPIMEEFELCKLLRRSGKLVLASTTVSTSARRFRQHGVLRLYARMWRVMFQYRCGTPLEELKRIYERK
jgi:rSAM/selenodomain-associated transferase 2